MEALGAAMQVEVLAARSQIDLLEEQAHRFCPKLIAVYDKERAFELQKRLPAIRVVGGMEGLIEAAEFDSVDLLISAIAGTIGIMPTVAAIRKGKHIALANKEVLVSAGEYVTTLAKERGVQIIPLDSEHSALFQCLRDEQRESVRRLILTASGGPFLHTAQEELKKIGVKEALTHPTWRMGPKISIDSSTLMNKGLEVIEAHWLFDIPVEKIEVVVHPQSAVHSFVEFVDGSILAQLSKTDMAIPIQFALTYPHRLPVQMPPFDFSNLSLQFFPPDTCKFPCLELAYRAIAQGGTSPSYLNAANEALVEQFLNGKIRWIDISQRLEKLLSSHTMIKNPSLDTILSVDTAARQEALDTLLKVKK